MSCVGLDGRVPEVSIIVVVGEDLQVSCIELVGTASQVSFIVVVREDSRVVYRAGQEGP